MTQQLPKREIIRKRPRRVHRAGTSPQVDERSARPRAWRKHEAARAIAASWFPQRWDFAMGISPVAWSDAHRTS